MNKYGSDKFYYEVLEDNVPYELLDEREVYYIEKFDSFHNGYNSTPGGDKKTIYKIEDIDDIISRLKQGEMIKNIASDYNVHPYTIRRTLQAYEIDKPSDIQGSHLREDLRTLPRNEIKKLYESGLSHLEIADKLDINPRSVSRVMKEFGINKRKMIDYNSLDLDSILIDFEKVNNGELKKKDVLNKYGLNQHSLKIIRKLKNIS